MRGLFHDIWYWVVGVFTILLVTTALATIPDVMTKLIGFTPGMVRHNKHVMMNYHSYRQNPDATITFHDIVTGTWVTLPSSEVTVYPRQAWWWQRVLPPPAKEEK